MSSEREQEPVRSGATGFGEEGHCRSKHSDLLKIESVLDSGRLGFTQSKREVLGTLFPEQDFCSRRPREGSR